MDSSLAKEREVDAIHPGYGFLSENSRFSRACAQAGITFIGPPPELLESLGDKTAARSLAKRAGVPTVPGTGLAPADPREILLSAESVGYPLIVKASFGGGGRGMRVVNHPDELLGRLEEASGEAQRSFGDGSVFLERYISRARHIEVQILADSHGSVVHLWERDCSVQRRHQKVVELAPAPNLPDQLRDKICAAAIRVAQTTGYVNAGTVEFLVDADTGEWFFIEVNPRIQVEHTVTELVTGVDLVRSQMRIPKTSSRRTTGACRPTVAPVGWVSGSTELLMPERCSARFTTRFLSNSPRRTQTFLTPAREPIELCRSSGSGG